MAEAVAHAFDTGEHLAVQAGTGTGKSLAYLVPALALAAADDDDDRGPVVVSTATIALQRQLVDRDLPRLTEALAGALPREPQFRPAQGARKLLVPEQDSQRVGGRGARPARRSCSSRSPRPRSAATCSG